MRNADAILFLSLYIVLGLIGLIMSGPTIAILFVLVVALMFPYGSYKIIKFLFRRRKGGTTKATQRQK